MAKVELRNVPDMTVSQEECRPSLCPTPTSFSKTTRSGMRGLWQPRADGSFFARAGGHKTARRWAPSEIRWECGHAAYSLYSGSLEVSPDDGVSVPALRAEILPIDGSFKRRAFFGFSYPKRTR